MIPLGVFIIIGPMYGAKSQRLCSVFYMHCLLNSPRDPCEADIVSVPFLWMKTRGSEVRDPVAKAAQLGAGVGA